LTLWKNGAEKKRGVGSEGKKGGMWIFNRGKSFDMEEEGVMERVNNLRKKKTSTFTNEG